MTEKMLIPTTVTGVSADSELVENMKILDEELLKNHRIDISLYNKCDVKRGLRDSSGKGVLTGLTEISDVVAYDQSTDKRVPIDGQHVDCIDMAARM